MKISIIIPTVKFENLKPCIESILKYTDLTDKEIIVVANGSSRETKNYIKKLGEPFKLIWFRNKLGFSKANNEGIKIATGDYIVLLNDDTILLHQEKDTWIKMLLEPFLQDEKVGITGPLKSFCPYTERKFIIFFCCCIKKKLFEEIGLLDEVFNVGAGEDTDFCIKAENLGYKIVQVPNENITQQGDIMVGSFPIYHKGEGTFSSIPKWKEIFERNSKILEERYKLPEGWFSQEDIAEYRRLANEVPDNGSIAELGVWRGRSLCSIADIIKRKNLTVIAVDTFKGTENEGTMHDFAKYNDLKADFENNLKRFGIFDKTIIIPSTTSEATMFITDKSLDLVMIDADHEYSAVKNDIKNWLPKIKGTIAGHDYMTWEGVTRAVNEIFKEVRVGGTIWSKKL